MQDKIYITSDGLKKLKEELKELLEVRVPEVAKRIKDARDLGDISENTAYDEAKREQALLEGKIRELEEIIKNAVVSDGNDKSTVQVGSKVKVHISGTEHEFHIVSALEADPKAKKISHESPIGAALIGKKIGDEVEVEAPVGKIVYKILEIN